MCDEVYLMFTYEKPDFSLRTAADLLENIVVIDSLSKSHAMSVWRVGWEVAPIQLTNHLDRFSLMSIFATPQFIQDAAAFALNNNEYYVREIRAQYQKSRDLVCSRLGQMPRLSYLTPELGMFIIVNISAFFKDDKEFAQELLDTKSCRYYPAVPLVRARRGIIGFHWFNQKTS